MNHPRRTAYGTRGEEVCSWQRYLSSQGFDPGPADGYHGLRTEQASVDYLKWLTAQTRGDAVSP